MNTFDIDYTSSHLEQLCKLVTESREEVILERPGKEDVVLVAASALSGLKETLHLLSSSTNAKYLFEAIEEVRSNQLEPQTIDELRRELSFYE